MPKIDKMISTIEKGINIVDKGSDLIKQVGLLTVLIVKAAGEIACLIKKNRRKPMDLLSLLKDIISVVVIANAVTGQKNTSMTEEYQEVLEKILTSKS